LRTHGRAEAWSFRAAFEPGTGCAFQLALDESNKLLTSEVARMCRDKVEETGLVLGVPERAKSDDVHAGDVHKAKISAVISWVSRTRRSLGWSCCRANKWESSFWPSRRVPEPVVTRGDFEVQATEFSALVSYSMRRSGTGSCRSHFRSYSCATRIRS